MKKKIYFLHCKNNVITLIAILLALLFILFIYSYIENNNISTNIIENYEDYEDEDDPLYPLVKCNQDSTITCGNRDHRVINGTCFETYADDREKLNRCIDIPVADGNTPSGNIERDMTARACQLYNSHHMKLQGERSYDC